MNRMRCGCKLDTSSTPNTFEHDTMIRRWPDIIERSFGFLISREQEGNGLSDRRQEVRKVVESLRGGGHSCVPSIRMWGPDPHDKRWWQAVLDEFKDTHWLNVPWFIAETAIYRLILDLQGFYEHSSPWYGMDPFEGEKFKSLESVTERMVSAWHAAVQELKPDRSVEEGVRVMTNNSLWANRVDLSLWTAESIVADECHGEMAVDHMSRWLQFIQRGPLSSIHIVLDNFGLELFTDLCYSMYLVGKGIASRVVLHCKSAPFFVSDATVPDVFSLLAYLKRDCGHADLAAAAAMVDRHLRCGSIELRADPFWVGPNFYFDHAPYLNSTVFADADAVIFKGDLNYRRLVGDYPFDPLMQFEKAVDYLDVPAFSIRTGKSTIAVGISNQERVDEIAREDSDWRWTGKWGFLSFVDGTQT